MGILFASTNSVVNFIGTFVMAAQVNLVSERLGLPMEEPFSVQTSKPRVIAFYYGSATTKGKPDYLLQGAIFNDQYTCSFIDGQLKGIKTLSAAPPRSDDVIMRRMDALMGQKSTISATNAYHLATNWLDKVNVDVEKLCSEYQLRIHQWKSTVRSVAPELLEKLDEPVMLPIFEVNWEKETIVGREKAIRPFVTVLIDGRTGELVEWTARDDIRTPNDTIFLVHPIRLVHVDELLSISETEFLKMDDTQKSNLVKRFVAPESMQRISSTKKDAPAKEQKTEEKKKTE
jgi:hypothetical protein